MNARGLIASWIALIAGCTAGGIGAGDPGAPGALRVDRMERADNGTPSFVRGELGRVAAPIADASRASEALAGVLPGIADLLGVPAADLVASRVQRDSLGMTHVRLEQRKNGLPVVGGEVVLHLAADGTVRSVTSSARDRALDAAPALPAAAAARRALEATEGGIEARRGELTYVVASGDGELYLAWEVEVVGASGSLVDDLVYVDALTGDVVDRHPQVFTARNRTIYDGMGGIYPVANAPVVGTESGAPTDPIALAAYEGTGLTYDCYKELFQRDSYDDAGAALSSEVHVVFQVPGGVSGNNAGWYQQTKQMAYGDGDGVRFGPTANGFDVTAHELTHGVTGATAKLAYQGESGALNEAMSDIMSAVCEAWRDKAITPDTWTIGEDIFTPDKAGDALRYMANPTMDMASYDYYPDRYTGQMDNGGVHYNSGIANLAFYLLTSGGAHPRARTAFAVPGIGIERAGAIFQRALTKGYFIMTTSFSQARTATEQVAMELYPGCTKDAVSTAWAAVGVGGEPPAPDAVPPTVAIAAPAEGAYVTPGFPVQVTAADDKCVLKVELRVDGVLASTVHAAPFDFTTDVNLAPGPHVIEVKTYDLTNVATATANVTIGAACTKDSQCEGGESCQGGICQPGGDLGGGCGCTSDGRGAAGALALMLATAFALRRRRPRRR